MPMRSHYCGHINIEQENQEITLVGWIHKIRNLGGVTFIDLRDREGLIQVVIDPKLCTTDHTENHLKQEYCLQIKGKVQKRPSHQTNTDLATGEIEVIATSYDIINASLPLPIDFNTDISEEQRLKYRYLDLRRPENFKKFQFRSQLTSKIRSFLEQQGFLDIETPMLTAATPEGARDYLVPSRTHKKHFFALPQSPQLFKQLLMISGFDKYYQIVKCFRDEDLRSDRQPEFTQIDIETSFMTAEEIQEQMESMIRYLFKELLQVSLPPFPKMTYAKVMEDYGSDKPDLRNPLILKNVSTLFIDSEFKVFHNVAHQDNAKIVSLKLPNGAQLSRKQIDNYTQFVSKYGAKGLAWIKINDTQAGVAGIQSPISKFLNDHVVQQLIAINEAQNNDLLFFCSDLNHIVNNAMGALRIQLGEDFNLIETGFSPLWVIDFPMFEKDEERLYACHHPFTSPKDADIEKLIANPEKALSNAYDMVINGYEVGGGSIRIHNKAMQSTIFNLLGISEEEAQNKFGFLLNALQYGTPIHGGIAFGLDRLAMLMLNLKSIKEVIVFPKTTTASCPLTHAPSIIEEEKLTELSIQNIPSE